MVRLSRLMWPRESSEKGPGLIARQVIRGDLPVGLLTGFRQGPNEILPVHGLTPFPFFFVFPFSGKGRILRGIQPLTGLNEFVDASPG